MAHPSSENRLPVKARQERRSRLSLLGELIEAVCLRFSRSRRRSRSTWSRDRRSRRSRSRDRRRSCSGRNRGSSGNKFPEQQQRKSSEWERRAREMRRTSGRTKKRPTRHKKMKKLEWKVRKKLQPNNKHSLFSRINNSSSVCESFTDLFSRCRSCFGDFVFTIHISYLLLQRSTRDRIQRKQRNEQTYKAEMNEEKKRSHSRWRQDQQKQHVKSIHENIRSCSFRLTKHRIQSRKSKTTRRSTRSGRDRRRGRGGCSRTRGWRSRGRGSRWRGAHRSSSGGRRGRRRRRSTWSVRNKFSADNRTQAEENSENEWRNEGNNNKAGGSKGRKKEKQSINTNTNGKQSIKLIKETDCLAESTAAAAFVSAAPTDFPVAEVVSVILCARSTSATFCCKALHETGQEENQQNSNHEKKDKEKGREIAKGENGKKLKEGKKVLKKKQ